MIRTFLCLKRHMRHLKSHMRRDEARRPLLGLHSWLVCLLLAISGVAQASFCLLPIEPPSRPARGESQVFATKKRAFLDTKDRLIALTPAGSVDHWDDQIKGRVGRVEAVYAVGDDVFAKTREEFTLRRFFFI